MDLIDQIGRRVSVPDDPQRIVSLVPSQSEFLADLQLGDRVVGITRFCERPRDWFYSKARIGGTKDPDLERIAALKPDLILGNFEENTKKSIQELEHRYPVWLSDVKDLSSAYAMMYDIGQMTHRQDSARQWIKNIHDEFERYPRVKTGIKVLYLIWKDPYMAAGRNTFINSMIEEAGFENALRDPSSRYPKLETEEIERLNPDLILLSSEPYPFSEEHISEFKNYFGQRALTVDGAAFSWYGSRLIHSPKYFDELHSQI
ncbi:MAG: ABC transporter substrate-binding protein [Flavobacteriia bacterium]|nr:ABC transporter substrate-binding protein [Flavobacteriia bacterium]